MDESIHKLDTRKWDPLTGIKYNMEFANMKKQELVERLVRMPQDKKECVEIRFKHWMSIRTVILDMFPDYMMISAERMTE